jgi:hypothetical protein
MGWGTTPEKIRNLFRVEVLFPVMKTQITTPTIVSVLALALLGSITLKAQEAQQAQESQSSIPQGSQPSAASPACLAKHGMGHGKQMRSVLNDQERSQLKSAMKEVKNDPQLVAAREALKDAQTKEAKKAAHDTLRQTRRDLLLKADPSLSPVLEKVKEAKHAKPPVS